LERNKSKPKAVEYGLTAWVGLVVGAMIAIPPLTADIKWMRAQLSRDALIVEESLSRSYFNPQNSFKYTETVLLFERSQLFELAHEYGLKSVRFNPDNYNAWKVLYSLNRTSEKEKSEALKNLKRLDPLNPNVIR
jgi:hypothetical protein